MNKIEPMLRDAAVRQAVERATRTGENMWVLWDGERAYVRSTNELEPGHGMDVLGIYPPDAD